MRILVFAVLLVILSSCNDNEPKRSNGFSSVEIKTLLKDSLLDVRAIEIMNDSVLIFPYNRFQINSYDILSESGFYIDWLHSNYPIFDKDVDTLLGVGNIEPKEIRSIASNNKSLFLLNVESPALINKVKMDTVLHANHRLQKVIEVDNHPKAFYDSMDFWNDQEGIAIGDPTDDCMSVIITRDSGETWTKLPCEDLPKALDGEAAFAASDTNIAIVDNHTWVATGGKASRILYSPDKGATWEVYDTPIIQGKETTGMYSLDFYDAQHGFAIGGDYTQPNDTIDNKIRTEDGGKTWSVVANGKGPGYRSCVQYVPNSNAKELVAVGFKGIDYTNDAGDSWKHLSDEGFYTIRFLNDSVAYAAGKGRISKLTFKN